MNSIRLRTRLKLLLVVFLAVVIVGRAISFLGIRKNIHTSQSRRIIHVASPTPIPTKDESFHTYTAPIIASKSVYTIFMVGDSMTHALGPHGGTFNTFINDLYKTNNKSVLIDNYAIGSKNILSLNEEMNTKTTYWDSTFEPLLSRQFDLILIESFGYNPLSQFPLDEGLKKQTQALDDAMKTILHTHPNSAIVFVATISPNKETYAKKVELNLSTQDRITEAEERIAYIKNHIDYAKAHNIPIINIYEKSLDAQGDGDLSYINPDDYIHPSFKGVDFIGHEIANFIYDNSILPK